MTRLTRLSIISLLTLAGSWSDPGSVSAAGRRFQGLLGTTLPNAQKADFFVWFHLAETGRGSDEAHRTVVTFKPEGEAFRKLVTLRTTLNAMGRIVEMDLHLSRAFINDRNQRAFANDIAKSLLVSATADADRPDTRVLVDEISSNRGIDTPVLSGTPLPDTPIKLSAGYLTYLGKRYSYTQESSGSRLAMENIKVDGAEWLRIQITLKE